MNKKLEKTLAKAIREILTNNPEIIDQALIDITRNEVRKLFENISKDKLGEEIQDIVKDTEKRIFERAQEILLVRVSDSEGGLREIDDVAKEHILKTERRKRKSET
jgi:hypothetical protein